MRTSLLVDVDLDAVVDHRIDPDAGERGVPARVGIERRDAHQPMHAALGLEPAIGVVALDLDGRRLDAGVLALGLLEQLDLVAVLLGPARVHAQQHARPSPGSRCRRRRHAPRDSSRWRRPRPTAAPRARGARPRPCSAAQRRLGLGDDALVASRPRRARSCVSWSSSSRSIRPMASSWSSSAVRSCITRLRALRVVPESGVFGLRVQLGEARVAPCRQSKMPPQQSDRLLDLVDDRFDFGAHGLTDSSDGQSADVSDQQRFGKSNGAIARSPASVQAAGAACAPHARRPAPRPIPAAIRSRLSAPPITE